MIKTFQNIAVAILCTAAIAAIFGCFIAFIAFALGEDPQYHWGIATAWAFPITGLIALYLITK